jgi:2-polyprenyl-3-methyl-5-hydroxy-6-metoxy-1,4-benzoquinol methylase
MHAPSPEQAAAYTTPRPDVAALVPAQARRILDVGCSNGALGRSLMAQVDGREVGGIEAGASYAAAAREVLSFVVEGDLNVLDWDQALAGRRFDCIVFADVLEHLADPRACLRQARAHLAPGGCVVLSVPNIRHLSALRAIFLQGRFPLRERGIFDRTHLRWFTIGDARALLAETGLTVSAMGQSLRWGDSGGGRANRLLNRLPAALQRWGPVRELLTYQVCLRAEAPR